MRAGGRFETLILRIQTLQWATVTFEDVIRFVQEHFTDGLVIVIGSGLSVAEGMPGMSQIAKHLKACAVTLEGEDATVWSRIQSVLDSGTGLEAALLKHAPSESLEFWIAKHTCDLLMPREREIICDVVKGKPRQKTGATASCLDRLLLRCTTTGWPSRS
jgi:hypothetical protein